MKPEKLGQTYDALAHWWREMHRESNYGMRLSRALAFVSKCGDALDVVWIELTNGDRARNSGFRVTGIDVSTG